MNLGQSVFSQLMEFLPSYQFRLCVDRYQGHRYVKSFSCWDQFLCLAFAQLTNRISLRDIEVEGVPVVVGGERRLGSFYATSS